MTSNLLDAVVIGGGPAGLSAGIYLSRAGQETLIIDSGDSALDRTDKVDNYLGFPDGTTGEELLELGRKHVERFGGSILGGEVLGVERNDEENVYVVETEASGYEAKGLVIATGVSFESPDVEGIDEFEGRGISYCVQCDAFFFRDAPVAVLGSENFAVKESLLLLDYTDDVRLLTDGEELDVDESLRIRLEEEGIPVIEGDVEGVKGDQKLERVVLESEEIEVDGLFVAIGTSGGTDLARMLGIPIDGSYLVVDEDLNTGVPRVYAAGDCIGGNRQVATAVGEGADAAINLLEELRGAKYVDYG